MSRLAQLRGPNLHAAPRATLAAPLPAPLQASTSPPHFPMPGQRSDSRRLCLSSLPLLTQPGVPGRYLKAECVLEVQSLSCWCDQGQCDQGPVTSPL